MRATYSVEDNKLRLYSDSRLSAELYEEVKDSGFQWAPKQECFVAHAWTPAREDLLLELVDEIEDEDYSPEERAADRAERFSAYRDRRAEEAGASADAFDSGPSAFGHQSAARAERLARRHDRKRLYACSQWDKAEYWQSRTQGVISHTLYKATPAVRRSRILRLEAEQRKHDRERAEYAERYAKWCEVPTLDGANVAGRYDGSRFDTATVTSALRAAYALANVGNCGWEYIHPRNGEKSSMYRHLTSTTDPLTPAECAALWLAGKADPADEESRAARWSRHYKNRLAYEKAMLANEGGMAGDADIIPGGFVRGARVVKVNKSSATGRVVSVRLSIDGKEKLVNVERLPEGAYRAPSPEELTAWQAEQKQEKAAKKATAPKAPPLVNPTDEDAQKLQDALNEESIRKGRASSEIWRMTQAEYSARSKGDYGTCETSDVTERVRIKGGSYDNSAGRVIVFKVRTGTGGFSARRVVVLTDKPQKSIPWDDVEAARAEMPSEAKLFDRLDDIAAALKWQANETEETKQLISDASYVGWVYYGGMTLRQWTNEGAAAYKRFKEQTVTV